jgi:hypothetical protein
MVATAKAASTNDAIKVMSRGGLSWIMACSLRETAAGKDGFDALGSPFTVHVS